MAMLTLSGVDSILCLGAHSDDIEIGAGASVLSLIEANPDVRVTWVVFAGQGARADEARASAARFLAGCTQQDVQICEFRDGYFPAQWAEIKQSFEALKRSIQSPDVVISHHTSDKHQDHRIVAELTWNTFRAHQILEYEVPKYDADLGSPNLYFPVSEANARHKVDILLECFGSQSDRHWFDELTFLGHMRLRGLECRAPSRFAEAFHARKVILDCTAVR
jgi:LmbE family N-acetylglucosaminyl deacetylase